MSSRDDTEITAAGVQAAPAGGGSAQGVSAAARTVALSRWVVAVSATQFVVLVATSTRRRGPRAREQRPSRTPCKSKWLLPLFAVALGLLVFVAQWIGGNPSIGLVSFAILAGAGVLLLLGGRSETIRGMRGDGRDERFRTIDIHATALAGLALITAIIIAFLVELARGHTGTPYSWLGAIGGITYIAAIIIFRIRG